MDRSPQFCIAFAVHLLVAFVGLGLLGWMVLHDGWSKSEQQWFVGILAVGLAGRLAAEWGYRQIKTQWARRKAERVDGVNFND